MIVISRAFSQQVSTFLTQRAPWLALALAVGVVTLRIFLARPLQFCGTPDACYYLGMAEALASGQGFHARFLYDFQQAHLSVPNTGIEYWRPGISLLLSSLKFFGGVTLFSSIAVTAFVGLFLSAAAWHIAMRATGDRILALGSFALCLLSNPLWIGSASPDSALYYGAATAWFLALFTAESQGWWADALALLCVALAYLIRNDAVLLFIPLTVVLWKRTRRSQRGSRNAPGAASSPAYTMLVLLGFLLALAPMHLLYHAVLGVYSPSGTSRVLYLNDLGDFERYGDLVSLKSMLKSGVKRLLMLRVQTFATVVYRAAVLMIGYPALIFLATWFGLRKRKEITVVAREPEPCLRDGAGPISFGFAVLLVYTAILPAIGQFSALRSVVGLMPFLLVYTLIGVRRLSKDRHIAAWLSAAVILANAIAGYAQIRRDIAGANLAGATDREQASGLARLHANREHSVILTGDPVQFSVTTGYTTVALPNNGLGAIIAAAHDLHVSYVLLNTDSLPAPRAVVEQQLHPIASYDLAGEHTWILQLSPDLPAHP